MSSGITGFLLAAEIRGFEGYVPDLPSLPMA